MYCFNLWSSSSSRYFGFKDTLNNCEVVHSQSTASLVHVSEAGTGDVLQEKIFLELSQNSQENTCAWVSLFFNKVAGFTAATLLKKSEALAQVFSCEFWESFKNAFLTKHLRTTDSDNCYKQILFQTLVHTFF